MALADKIKRDVYSCTHARTNDIFYWRRSCKKLPNFGTKWVANK